ncbi:biotin---protein ligase, partial [Paragonimus westermani]
FFAKLPAHSGLVVVSNRQTRAKGRGGNRWITPPGQAAFTFHLTLTKPEAVETDVQTSFMQYVTCMQHLVALSVVLAFKQLVCERLGVLCNLQSGLDTDEEFLLLISTLGINVSNPLPTICLQEVLNRACPNSNPVSVAKVIATVLSRLERLIDRMLYAPKPCGLTWALSLYTQCWMHSNQSVQVHSLDKTPINCVVIGVDDFGYLRVRDSTNGAEFSLHPDGNSMDMMRGLIVPKTHS